jgi:hypothetical protein
MPDPTETGIIIDKAIKKLRKLKKLKKAQEGLLKSMEQTNGAIKNKMLEKHEDLFKVWDLLSTEKKKQDGFIEFLIEIEELLEKEVAHTTIKKYLNNYKI